MDKGIEPLSDHPLFRALVLMGGSLALGCGGIAQYESPGGVPDTATGGAANGAAAGSNNTGGSGIVLGGVTQTTGGSGGAVAPYNPACPYAQWDCNTLSIGNLCYFNVKSKDDPVAAGCTCDTARPKSAAACKVGEAFVCRRAFPPYVAADPPPTTWDGTLHIQCECVPGPTPTEENCGGICVKAYGGVGMVQCRLPGQPTCDEGGMCTATAADVLRQDGVLCGCADIGLK